MRLHYRTSLIYGIISITLVGIFGPLFVVILHKDVYHQMLSNTRLVVENVFNLQPVFNNHSHSGGHFEKKYKYLSFNIKHPEIYRLKDSDIMIYFRNIGSVQCFINGTNWELTKKNSTVCLCLENWYGAQCGIPGLVLRSLLAHDVPVNSLKVRTKPRRIIHGFNVNHEIDMLEVRVNELQEAVDVYLICESNFTAFGEKKPLYFLDRFRQGFLREFQHNIVYVYQNHFPRGGRTDGWIADGYQRTFLGQQGMKQLKGLRDDDLFLILDADEIPKKQVLMFLKLYDGYPVPISINLRWTVFGFFWSVPYRSTQVSAIASIAMFQNAMGNDGALLRSGQLHPSLSHSYFSASGKFQPWTLGGENDEVGWHCSWCLSPQDIRWKLNSAQNGDKPRWGDYPKKKNLTYIQGLIRTGTWFDDMSKFERQLTKDVAKHVPQYVFQHPAKFRSILVNLYDDENVLQMTFNEFKKWFGIA